MATYTLGREHYSYFEKQKFLELEGLFPAQQLQQLKSEIDQKIFPVNYGRQRHEHSPEKLFLDGRDLWRKSPLVKRITLDKQLAKIASELTGEKFLRMGYDQLLTAANVCAKSQIYSSKAEILEQVLLTGSDLTLETMSSVQGVLCGALISLNDAPEGSVRSSTSLFPVAAGNIVYFMPQVAIDFSELLGRGGQEFLLLVYAAKTSLYIANERDPNLHAFKQLGYVFGDRLTDPLNPVLCR